MSASVSPTTALNSVSRQPAVTFLCSEDSLRLIGCRDGSMSVHVLAPYPGWENRGTEHLFSAINIAGIVVFRTESGNLHAGVVYHSGGEIHVPHSLFASKWRCHVSVLASQA